MRALVFLLPGLGDALVASPLFAAASASGWELDAVTMLEPVRDYADALGCFSRIDHFDLFDAAAGSSALAVAGRLRRRRYDIAMLPFPATRWQYHALAAVAGAKSLATHDYGGVAAFLDRLIRANLVALEGGHRIWENVRLARAIGLREAAPLVLVPDAWRRPHEAGLVGLHPGTMRYKGNEHRRWPLERFVALAGTLASSGARVRVFVGPSERADARAFETLANGSAVEIVDAPLADAARSLAACSAFVGNDAGFAHLAAALGVKTVALFGMSDPRRAQPVGPSVALRPSSCPPCHDEGMRTFECVRRIGYRCILDDLSVAAAAAAVDAALRSPMATFVPLERSDFALYGRRRASANSASDVTTQTSADASETASGR